LISPNQPGRLKEIKARLHCEIACNKKIEVEVTLFLGLIFSKVLQKSKAYRWEAHKGKERQQLIFLEAK